MRHQYNDYQDQILGWWSKKKKVKNKEGREERETTTWRVGEAKLKTENHKREKEKWKLEILKF